MKRPDKRKPSARTLACPWMVALLVTALCGLAKCHAAEGQTVPMPGKDRDAGAVCLAVLRRDGFISLDAGEEPGTLLTKPFVLGGTTLHVNADAKSGEVAVTLLGWRRPDFCRLRTRHGRPASCGASVEVRQFGRRQGKDREPAVLTAKRASLFVLVRMRTHHGKGIRPTT